MYTQIREVSIAVRDLDSALAAFRTRIGVEPRAVQEHLEPPIQARTAVFPIGGSGLALMEATEDDSPIGRFIAGRGEGLFSVSLAVDNLDEASEKLAATGAPFLLRDAIEFSNFETYDGMYRRVRMNFTRPSNTSGVLFELQQLER